MGCRNLEYVVRDAIPMGYYLIFQPSTGVTEIIGDAHNLVSHIDAISTDHIHFTADGPKYIWKEPEKPGGSK